LFQTWFSLTFAPDACQLSNVLRILAEALKRAGFLCDAANLEPGWSEENKGWEQVLAPRA
jgi:hypothetical protein